MRVHKYSRHHFIFWVLVGVYAEKDMLFEHLIILFRTIKTRGSVGLSAASEFSLIPILIYGL